MGPIVEIIVRGDVGAGKTTISQLIEKALRGESLSNYTVVDEECEINPETFSRRIESLKHNNVDIRIKVENMSREEVKTMYGKDKQ
jgi:predicted ATP-binding protein involved in virulence